MTTLTILAGFALMLFLPCVLTLLSLRDREDPLEEVYEDLLAVDLEISPLLLIAAESLDPATAERSARLSPTRLELAEIEVMRSRAVAIRAHADALEAVAQAALAKAEAAAQDALIAEMAAAEAMLDLRHAA